MSVLHRLNEDICVVEHEVVCAHAGGGARAQELVDYCVLVASVTSYTLQGDVVDCLLNGFHALRATLHCGRVDLVVELPEVSDRLHDTRAGPGGKRNLRIVHAEPCRQSTRIGTSNHHCLSVGTSALSRQEDGQILQGLLRRQVHKVFEGPVRVGLRLTVIPVLDNEEFGAVGCTDHEGVEAEGGHRASVFTADVDKDRARFFISAVDIVGPVSLLVGLGRLVVEVIDLVCEPVLVEISFIHGG